MIRRLTSANRTRFIITADHGFQYRRNKLKESDKVNVPKGDREGGLGDKIASVAGAVSVASRRYLLADKAIVSEGIASMELGVMMQN